MALALELTDSALAKVDPTDTARNARMPVLFRVRGQSMERGSKEQSSCPYGVMSGRSVSGTRNAWSGRQSRPSAGCVSRRVPLPMCTDVLSRSVLAQLITCALNGRTFEASGPACRDAVRGSCE